MLTIGLSGGLGNQLFQYALGRSLEINAPGDIQYDMSAIDNDMGRVYLLDKLGLTNLQLVHQCESPKFVEGSLRFKPEILEFGMDNDLFLQGYWQCEQYFKRVQHKIRSEVFRGMPLSEETRQVAEKIKQGPSAFLHIRRSDNLSQRARVFHGELGENYYKTAMDLIRGQISNVHFYLFSDEAAWCKQNMKYRDATVIDCNPMSGICDSSGIIHRNNEGREVEDLYLMSLCDHGILANSTFSWWGAWLSPKETLGQRIIIAPKAWFVAGSDEADPMDIIPERWLKL